MPVYGPKMKDEVETCPGSGNRKKTAIHLDQPQGGGAHVDTAIGIDFSDTTERKRMRLS